MNVSNFEHAAFALLMQIAIGLVRRAAQTRPGRVPSGLGAAACAAPPATSLNDGSRTTSIA